MKKIMMAAAAFCCVMTMTVLTACTSDNDDNPTPKPTDGSALVGTWVSDLTGKTHTMWTYGKAWNVWTFNADGTGVCDVYFTSNDQPMALQHQPFTYTVEGGNMTVTMADGPWDDSYQIVGDRLTIGGAGEEVTFDKADAAQIAQFDEWSKRELLSVPAEARYTVFVYGNAGGKMDYCIEDQFMDALKPYLTDAGNVRVVCFYKYGKDLPEEGKPFSGKYADPGDIVWFELNSKTDLNKLREEGLASHGFAEQAKKLKLCDPASISTVMELSSLLCPAKEYIFTIWGHGNGFEPMYDVPGKYDVAATRGVIGDEWNEDEKLDMYELSQAIRSTGKDGKGHIKTIFFHNCLMGNIESLTELRDVADYIACSAHLLNSDYSVLPAFIRGLIEKGNVEDAFSYMLSDATPAWPECYSHDEGKAVNGDFKMLRTADLDGIINVSKRLADRLVALYPTQKEAIDRANTKVYRFFQPFDNPGLGYFYPFFDLADYAHKLAEETGDAEFAAISSDLDQAFDKAILQRADISWSVQRLDRYSLSVCLYWQNCYDFDFVGAAGNPFGWIGNIGEGYEQSSFHKLTGWGNWLRTNTGLPWGNPTSGGGGLAE